MSLLRLLTAGKCLVGQKETGTRYRMTDPRALPKFGSAKRSFDGAPKAESRTAAGPVSAGQPSTVAQGTQSVAETSPPSGVPGSLSAQMPVPNLGGKVGDERIASSDGGAASFMARRPEGGLAREDSWIARFWDRLAGMLFARRKSQLACPAIPQFTRQPVQGELSLDAVQVVRNDLSDADLEVVPAKGPAVHTRTGFEAPPAEESTPAKAESGRPALRASALWRGVGKNGPAEAVLAPGTDHLQGAGKI
jgi:hypothetical protein